METGTASSVSAEPALVNNSPLISLFTREEDRFKTELNDLSKNIDTNSGSVCEELVKATLQRFIKNRSINKGVLVDIDGLKTNELDIIVHDSSVPQFSVDVAESFHIVPIEAAFAVIEVKKKACEGALRDTILKFSNIRRLRVIPDAGTGMYHKNFVQCHPFCALLMLSWGGMSLQRAKELLIEDPIHTIDYIGIISEGFVVNPRYFKGYKDNSSYTIKSGRGISFPMLLHHITNRPRRRTQLPVEYYYQEDCLDKPYENDIRLAREMFSHIHRITNPTIQIELAKTSQLLLINIQKDHPSSSKDVDLLRLVNRVDKKCRTLQIKNNDHFST